jgi:arylsulfatase A-like enzyme
MANHRGITRRHFLHGVAAGAVGAACDGPGWLTAGSTRQPNIVLLLTDDQRADSLGMAGNPIAQTPVLDALALQGTVFDEAFVTTSVCACSRASIFTGQYMRRHGIHHFGAPLSPESLSASYPVRLRHVGYRTGFFGKWGLGGQLPRRSFDAFEGFSGQGEYFVPTPEGPRHLTGLLADQVTEFVNAGPREQPFCASVSFKAPHGPWTESPKDLDGLFVNDAMPIPATATMEDFSRLPPFLKKSMGSTTGNDYASDPTELSAALRRYYRMVTTIDRAVGDIMDGLREGGVEGDTVVVFTSDNGMMIGEHGLSGKWLMFEESIRIPMFIYDPRLPDSARGRRVDGMALNIDIAPTLLDLAGASVPQQMQGRSLVPWLGGEPVEWRRDWYYEHDLDPGFGYIPVMEGVREQRWKYIHYTDVSAESLFDLEADPAERNDLAGLPDYASELERLRARCRELRATVA